MDHLKARSSHSVDNWDYRAHGPPGAHQSVSDLANQTDGDSSLYNSSTHDPSRTLGLREEVTQNVEDPKIQIHGESRSESSKINGTLKEYPGGQRASNNVGFSQFSSPSTAPFSPSRYDNGDANGKVIHKV